MWFIFTSFIRLFFVCMLFVLCDNRLIPLIIIDILTLLHSEWSKLHRVLAVVSAIVLNGGQE